MTGETVGVGVKGMGYARRRGWLHYVIYALKEFKTKFMTPLHTFKQYPRLNVCPVDI
jgi:hypothetical protein